MEKKPKKILEQRDIDNLKEGDLVRVSGYGRMMLNSIDNEGYQFLGRCKSRTMITELTAKRKAIFPEGNPRGYGNIYILDNKEFPYTKDFKSYQTLNRALRERGI